MFRFAWNRNRRQGSQPLEVGERGRLYRGSAVLCQGRHVVRIVAFGECPPEALAALARALSGRLGQ